MNCANHPDRERVAFCQNCGKPLCQECMRTVGTLVFCEPCLAARVGAGPVGGGTRSPYGAGSGVGQPLIPGEPSPALAALLGFLPGVGAMYNEQYAKGIVHLIVFAVLVSLAHEIGIFHLLAFGWVIYQVIDAHHTARARRDGTPLPNPFGLNEVGERLGFGRAWPAGAPPAGTPYTPPVAASYTADPAGNVAYTGSDAAPSTQAPTGSQSYSQPYGQPYTQPYAPPTAGWGAPQDTYRYGAPPVPPIPPPPPIPPYPDPSLAYQPRFPAGAIWLIGLGVLFLFGNIGIFHFFRFIRAGIFWPLVVIGIGVWVFIRRMTFTGAGVSDDGSPDYGWRLARAVRSSMWIVLTGILWLLSSLDILSWGHSWPLYLIAGGLMLFFRQGAFGGYGAYSGYPPYPPPPTVPPAPPVTTTAIVPTGTHDASGVGTHDDRTYDEQGGR